MEKAESDDIKRLMTAGAFKPEHYAAIGEMAAEFAALEWFLRECIITIAKLDPVQGNIITGGFGIRDSMTALQNLVIHKFGKDSEAATHLAKLYIEVNDAIPIRNKIVHDQWQPTDEPGVMHHWDFSGNRHTAVHIQPVKLELLHDLSKRVGGLTVYFVLWHDRFLAPPSPDTPPSESR